MNEWFKRFWASISSLWAKWTLQQKLIAGGIVAAAFIGLILLIALSGAPTNVALFNVPITDPDNLTRIEGSLEAEGIPYSVSAENRIYVPDAKTAKRAKAILVREDLIPKGTSPWDFLSVQNWTQTDFERDQNLRLAIQKSVQEHIESLDEIDSASVIIDITKTELFSDDQKPYKASIIIAPKPGAEMTRKKIEGIQKLVITAVSGLSVENITIADRSGNVLNDFEGMEANDRVELAKKEFKLVQAQEAIYKMRVLDSLQKIYGVDRVRDLIVTIAIDMSKKTVDSKEMYPITIKERTPGLPYDDSVVEKSLVRSEQTSSTTWQGTGYNPQGPAGVEGQTSTNYVDTQNVNGKVEQKSAITNYEMNTRNIQEEKSPQITRITVSVNIDGISGVEYDASGNPVIENGIMKRTYTPISGEELKQAESLIQNAVGYDKARGDSVSVQNIRFDRTGQYKAEDQEFVRQQQLSQTILYILLGLAVLLVSFIVFRLISRELERRKRLKEEELSRQHQIMRERALQQAEEEGIEVSMSVEERKRLEMQENAINMAKEHPEDVAQLIRTWLMEE